VDRYSFRGHYVHSMDDKGRILIPKPYRFDKQGDSITTFIVTRGFGDCLYVFPSRQWEAIEDKLKKKDIDNAKDAYDLRKIMAFTEDQHPDGMGRIMLSKYLREYALLDSDVVIVGMLDHLEIWDLKVWEEYLATDEHSGEEDDSLALKIGFFDGEYS